MSSAKSPRVRAYLAWLRAPEGARASPEEAHRRFVLLRLRFNVVLSHFDMFSEVQTQRSESENGVFLAGLDAVAAEVKAAIRATGGLPFEVRTLAPSDFVHGAGRGGRYLLPSRDLPLRGGGVFWPRRGEPGADIADASDHHLVWIDVGPR